MTAIPKISVVIPCFNHGEFLPEAVASITSLNRDDVELIVVDDGSTDERTSKEMAAVEAAGIRVIRQANKGLAAARNAAIAASNGEYILPLDADDRLRPGYLDHGFRILDADSLVGVVYGDMEFFGASTGRWVTGPFNANRMMVQNYIACSAIFRRVIWEQNEGYDGTMPVQGFEDWDFWIGAYEHGWKFAYVPEVAFDYRQHRESMLTRGRASEPDVALFIARKHVALYKREWQQLAFERDSGKATFRNLRRIIKARIRQKLGRNGNHVE